MSEAHLSLLGLHRNKKAAPLTLRAALLTHHKTHIYLLHPYYTTNRAGAWKPRPVNPSEDAMYPYTFVMADEDTVLEEAMDNLKEAGGRIRATQSLMRSEGMTDGENYLDLLTRLSITLAMTEAAYLEARRRRDL
jgi:hypothetical protein